MLKVIVRKVLPSGVYVFLEDNWRKYKLKTEIIKSYKYDMHRYLRYSDTGSDLSSQNLLGKIIKDYHVIEKGLTMPETRLGFGKDKLIGLINHCIDFIDKYGNSEEQVIHAVGVILEYEEFHERHNFSLSNDIVNAIQKIKAISSSIIVAQQRDTNPTAYFEDADSTFNKFALSRSSIRNYSNESVPTDRVIQALELAKTAPSACNRQCWRTYVFENKETIRAILDVQGGTRGFGHLADKLIVITSEIGVFSNGGERNQAFIDGGIYAMNLLYSLHHYKIAACILNCSNSITKDVTLRKLCGIKDSEVFIAMISCGMAPPHFKIAVSKRHNIDKTNIIIK